ncbi:metal ABC transporter substrate-binding protein [Arenibaculum pallidiluteum]|uniref:metal ABC transporter substrate-binding protein n=1 Tax=Arenibaculum pallidiluteum TaxID=2812559 RepID=UPI001A96A440|nr:metal ABC transporter substrate-binding protein [Arenibaculum pallidiluteum]
MLRRLLLVLGLAAATPVAAEPLKVVASFSILDDMVRQVGGEEVSVTTLVGPDQDAHVYEPSPADARAVAGADLVVVNGLGFEGWMDRLIRASGTKARVVTASARVKPISEDENHGHGHGHGGADPHAWHSILNAMIYVDNILSGLIQAAPLRAEVFRARAAAYREELDRLDAGVRRTFAAVPADRLKVLTSHDAFGYFARDYRITFLAPVGFSTEAEPSAGEVARLIRQVRKERVRAVFIENITDPRLIEQIARESGAKVGGTLYSDALSAPGGPAATYVEMIRQNARQIAGALAGE